MVYLLYHRYRLPIPAVVFKIQSQNCDERFNLPQITHSSFDSIIFQERSQEIVSSRSGSSRSNLTLGNCLRALCCRSATDKREYGATRNGDIEDLRPKEIKQYRLEAARRKNSSSIFSYICCCGLGPDGGLGGIGVSQNKTLSSYLHWMFRVNFLLLFILSCVVFFTLIVGFTGLLVLVGKLDNECIRIGEKGFGGFGGAAFADAFALSWTTFATVGYGSSHPALSNENESPNDCVFVSLLCSFESFIGVLYSGFCGAILFGKVLRIQSHAQVMFSDPIVVRYGTNGVGNATEDEEKEDKRPDKATKDGTQIPCPVLEFRVVNQLFDEIGGEIMDATLNVVANVDANDIDNLVESDRRNSVVISEFSTRSIFQQDDKQKRPSLLALQGFAHLNRSTTTRIGTVVSKRVFSTMKIEARDHPFFKRVWLARHVLDESSPVLTAKARRAIRRNGGFWPEHLNNYKGVRQSLKFNQILVSLNGVSNVSASDVYAQNIYDFSDLNIGYEFVNLLYRDGEGLKVDTDLVNDVREQKGGGGEPIMSFGTG